MFSTLLRPTAAKRLLFFVLADMVLSLVTLYLAYLLRFNFVIPPRFLETFWLVYALITSLKIAWLFGLKIYYAVWRFFSFFEAKRLVMAHVVAYALFVGIYWAFPQAFIPFPRSVILIDAVLSLVVLGALRFAKRWILDGKHGLHVRPTLIFGVGSQSATIIQSALKGEMDYYPQAVFSLDEGHRHAYINNVKIYPLDQLESLAPHLEATAAILARPIPQEALRRLTDRLNMLGIFDIKRVKLLGSDKEQLEDLSIEDLLARKPQDLDTDVIGDFIRGKRVIITGAGGSIGSEIARQSAHFGAATLDLVDNGEFNLYQIGEQLPEAGLYMVDVTNRQAIDTLIATLQPDVVIHAAAYKHVPLCEANPKAAVHNNIMGSQNVIDSSIAHGVGRLVIISTDKAVRPTNVMGATKRVVELYAQNVDAQDTEIVSVRFGNVLGSSGSVIPKFKSQIEAGGPVTITHPEMTRYFMLIPEACQLVLQAAAIAQGGELFILDMGEPVKIVDLAKQMIRLYGKEQEVSITFSGIRPGEKLYEELLISPDDAQTQYPSITVTKSTLVDLERLKEQIEAIAHTKDIRAILQTLVPEYQY